MLFSNSSRDAFIHCLDELQFRWGQGRKICDPESKVSSSLWVIGSVGQITWGLLECGIRRIREPAPGRTKLEARKAWETNEQKPKFGLRNFTPDTLILHVRLLSLSSCVSHSAVPSNVYSVVVKGKENFVQGFSPQWAHLWKHIHHFGTFGRKFPRRLRRGISPKEVPVGGSSLWGLSVPGVSSEGVRE